MAKTRSGSSAGGTRAAKNARRIPDSQIDFSDIPESTDEELRRARRIGRPKTGRPPRQLIAIRIDPFLLKRLRALAAKQKKPYQTFIHELLEQAAKRAAWDAEKIVLFEDSQRRDIAGAKGAGLSPGHPGQNEARVPFSEAEQLVAAVKKNWTPVWYLMAKDEGHGFAKKRNADFQFYATVLFMKECLLK
jgi:uncharacterized protein (DUF4415 family)